MIFMIGNAGNTIHHITRKAKLFIENCLTIIKNVLIILIGLFYLSQLFPSASNYILNYYSTPEIVGATPHESQLIESALSNTEKDIVRYIKSVTVIDNLDTLNRICEGEAMGCAAPIFINDALSSAQIYIASTNTLIGWCNSFEHTLYHEIGHVVDAYHSGDYGVPSEIYAEDYANKYSKDKCDTKEFKRLEQSISETNATCNEKFKTLSKWDMYEHQIPSELYNQYLQDYVQYSSCISEYNRLINVSDAFLNE